MTVFSRAEFDNHETVIFRCVGGLRAIIAVHDTTLGPALGGARMWPYGDEAEALCDVLKLSRAMTYKNALAGLDYGGGKAVIIGDPRRDKSPDLWRAFGRFVGDLGGRYITAEDPGTSLADLELVRGVTPHVAGVAEGGAGDPSSATAWGVFHGIRAAMVHGLGCKDLKDVTVAVQGLGHVGWHLLGFLHAAGARLVVADLDDMRSSAAVNTYGAVAVAPEHIHAVACDVFAPCAMGGAINDQTLPELKAVIVAGSANNQLAEQHHGEALRQRGILYAPDYVINAGGVINISHEGPDYDRRRALTQCAGIYHTLLDIFARADEMDLSTGHVADIMAQERLTAARAPLAMTKTG